MSNPRPTNPLLTRRTVLRAGGLGLGALLLAACSGDANSDPAFNTPEAQALKEWARQLKAEDRESMHALIRECGIGAAFALGQVRIGRDEPVERPAAVADDHPQAGEAVEHVGVAEHLAGPVLLGHETELVVVGHVAEPGVEAVGAVHDDRQGQLLAAFVERVPPPFGETGPVAPALGVGTDEIGRAHV
mgnify:CR=1 FL=1